MSKKVVDGIEISDDVPVTEYEGKFSGSFELEVEKAASMAYDDEVVLVVQARLDSYAFKPTKYGDLRRVNTFKVDSVTVKGGTPSYVAPVQTQTQIVEDDPELWSNQVRDPAFPDVDGESDDEDFESDEIFTPEPYSPPTPEVSFADPGLADENDGGRNYRDPVLRKFMSDLGA